MIITWLFHTLTLKEAKHPNKTESASSKRCAIIEQTEEADNDIALLMAVRSREITSEPTNRAKRKQIAALRRVGLTYAEIGRRLGLSKERVRQIHERIPKPKKPALEFDTLLMTADVARMLGIHVNTVRRWADRGFLKAYAIGPRGDRRFRQRDIESVLVVKSSASTR